MVFKAFWELSLAFWGQTFLVIFICRQTPSQWEPFAVLEMLHAFLALRGKFSLCFKHHFTPYRSVFMYLTENTVSPFHFYLYWSITCMWKSVHTINVYSLIHVHLNTPWSGLPVKTWNKWFLFIQSLPLSLLFLCSVGYFTPDNPHTACKLVASLPIRVLDVNSFVRTASLASILHISY